MLDYRLFIMLKIITSIYREYKQAVPVKQLAILSDAVSLVGAFSLLAATPSVVKAVFNVEFSVVDVVVIVVGNGFFAMLFFNWAYSLVQRINAPRDAGVVVLLRKYFWSLFSFCSLLLFYSAYANVSMYVFGVDLYKTVDARQFVEKVVGDSCVSKGEAVDYSVVLGTKSFERNYKYVCVLYTRESDYYKLVGYGDGYKVVPVDGNVTFFSVRKDALRDSYLVVVRRDDRSLVFDRSPLGFPRIIYEKPDVYFRDKKPFVAKIFVSCKDYSPR